MSSNKKWMPEAGTGVVFSAHQESMGIALNEIYAVAPGAKFGKWLDKTVGGVSIDGGFAVLASAFRKTPPIFLRHIFPVLQIVDMESVRLQDALAPMIERLGANLTFSIQMRSANRATLVQDICKQLTAHIESLGYVLNARHPEQVISIYVADGLAYCGHSDPTENLSIWAGGIRRFSRERDWFISRAQFKLVESFEAFDLGNVDNGDALDLGAAPGGWCKVLLDKGYKVWAVDPALLHPDLMQHGAINYIQGTTQKFLRNNKRVYDLITNDMIIDAREAALLMNDCAMHLRDGGQAIMTIKLPKKNTYKRMRSALKLLERAYVVEGVKQLSQNRSEVTALLKKR